MFAGLTKALRVPQTHLSPRIFRLACSKSRHACDRHNFIGWGSTFTTGVQPRTDIYLCIVLCCEFALAGALTAPAKLVLQPVLLRPQSNDFRVLRPWPWRRSSQPLPAVGVSLPGHSVPATLVPGRTFAVPRHHRPLSACESDRIATSDPAWSHGNTYFSRRSVAGRDPPGSFSAPWTQRLSRKGVGGGVYFTGRPETGRPARIFAPIRPGPGEGDWIRPRESIPTSPRDPTVYGLNWRAPTRHTGGGGTHPRADAGGPGCDRAAGPGGKLCHIYYKNKPKPHSWGY